MRSKKLFLFLVLSSFGFWAKAQLGNEWINFAQEYYKIPVAEEGVYRITYQQLSNLGVPLSTIDPRSFQIFHRGREINLFVKGENDAVFDPTDYVEFLGYPNDGKSDTLLYENPSDQPHTYYNIYTDTTAYFFTWRKDGGNGLRMPTRAAVNNTGGLTATSSYQATVRQLYTSNASAGQTYPLENKTYKSAFDLGEGWTGAAFSSTSKDYTISGLDKSNTGGPQPTLTLLIQGRNDNAHQVEVQVGPSAGSLRSLGTVSFNAYNFRKYTATLNWSDIDTGNGQIVVRLTAQATAPDRISLSYGQVDYAKNTDFSTQTRQDFVLTQESGGQAYLKVDNVPNTATLYEVEDTERPAIQQYNYASGGINTVVSNLTSPTHFALSNGDYLSTTLEPVTFPSYNQAQADYVILTHSHYRQPVNGNDPVQAYADYRASAAGGGYKTLIANVEDLYNEFNYGETSPMAIFRFARFLYQNYQPRFLFIIGKGVNWQGDFYRTGYDPATQYPEYVPTSGYPGSDVLFSQNLGPDPLVPAFATGRLNAHDAADVLHYLDKIKEMDAKPVDNLRRKQFVQLSGGLTAFELVKYRNYSRDLLNKAEGYYLGGKGEIISKQTNNAVELINIADEVNQGLALITFFGHSGSTQTDIDIGFVSDPVYGYDNKGKYPFILVNGCDAGEFFNENKAGTTFGEDWVNAQDKGALGVLAHSNIGIDGELKSFSDQFYYYNFEDSLTFGGTVGENHQRAIKQYVQNIGGTLSPLQLAQVDQMNLLGDPAFRIFPANAPDYAPQAGSIQVLSTDGQPVTALSPSFALQIPVVNLGKAIHDSLRVAVNRFYPDGSMRSYDTLLYAPLLHDDTLTYTIDNANNTSYGNNTFQIIVDPGQRVSELNEQNNTVSFDYFLPLSATLNLYPYPKAIIHDQTVTLKTQSTDPFSDARDFTLEIDTAADFSSPWKMAATANGRVLAQHDFQLLAQDSVTYFWRSRYTNPAPGEVTDWQTSSFTYYQPVGTEGWVQNRLSQYLEGDVTGLVPDTGDKWKFQTTDVSLEVSTTGTQAGGPMSIVINGQEFATIGTGVDPCDPNSVNLVAFDKSSGAPYRILSSGGFDVLDPLSCGRRPQVINQIFNNQLSNPAQYLDSYIDQLPAGDYVLLVTYDSVAFSTMVANSRSKLISVGATGTTLDNLQNGEPYILLGRKGLSEGQATEVTANPLAPDPPKQQTISLQTTVTAQYEQGTVFTEKIGPSLGWQNIHFNMQQVENTDVYAVDVFGIDTLNNQTLLFSGVQAADLDISSINAAQYPFLKLRLTVADPINLTPAQLHFWQVDYVQPPEGLLIPAADQPKNPGTIAEGATYPLKMEFVNVGKKAFADSSDVTYTLRNLSSATVAQGTENIKPLAADSTVYPLLSIPTKGKQGENVLQVKANRNAALTEQFSQNNYLAFVQPLKVLADSLPPFVNVTFDGRQILDGELVSARPLIQVKLKDENNYLQVQDTSSLEVYLKQDCDNCTFRKIIYQNPNVSWKAASAKAPFTFSYQPSTLQDGTYHLRVQAKDASGNTSGQQPYEISFEVLNKATITHFYPYPNPFSTQTRFVFTLTGSEIPEAIKIQIMTISGRVVKEINQDEIGPIHVGNNITEYAWDGRDEYGDLLANGVYLYRVFVKLHGKFVEHRPTAADKAFNRGFGKLYILR